MNGLPGQLHCMCATQVTSEMLNTIVAMRYELLMDFMVDNRKCFKFQNYMPK